MFDLTSSKLLILAVVALLVVGPKDFPVLLRTVGRYLGILRRQATEFRTQFDAAIREAELDQMKQEVEKMSRDIEQSVREADAKMASEMGQVGREAEEALQIPPKRPDRVQISDPPPPAAVTADASGPSEASATANAEPTPAAEAPRESLPTASEAVQQPLPRPGSVAAVQPSHAPAAVGSSSSSSQAASSSLASAEPVPAGASDKRSA